MLWYFLSPFVRTNRFPATSRPIDSPKLGSRPTIRKDSNNKALQKVMAVTKFPTVPFEALKLLEDTKSKGATKYKRKSRVPI